ncbi:hypothetical protein QIS99_29935 [Streptomyces sp. B-S-A8]|uniref:Uncharacterized protein n=1 Tax=Streptomyces solicavernae TaxID=3043614 RepID=A0ABT6S110_9ACTN|nr:hypothetical protein [Streptomyces sp. B-S-A8]MDI3390380.1 hypothetical protein [Streptomyces sp. B-S-A8]
MSLADVTGRHRIPPSPAGAFAPGAAARRRGSAWLLGAAALLRAGAGATCVGAV